MKNDCTKIIFYLNMKNVYKNGSAKFQHNLNFSSWQMKVQKVWWKKTRKKKKKKKKVGKPIGDPVGGRDTPIKPS